MRIKSLLRAGVVALLPVSVAGAVPEGSAPVAIYQPSPGVDAGALRAAVEPLFDADADQPLGETRALIVLRDGEVVAERHAPGFGPDTRHLSWSVAKTVTAVLLGIMVTDGRLALDDPAPVAAWRGPGDPRGRITLRQMLEMRSGIAHNERSEPLEDTDTMAMLVGRGAQDMAAYAVAKPLAAEPGTEFTYSSATTLILCDMMARLLTDSDDPATRRAAMMGFVEQRLARPAGMGSLMPEFDPAGTMICGAMMHMTARDYARLGELLRQGGQSGGRQLVGQGWVRYMTSPSAKRPGYGAHVWLNRDGADNVLFVGEASRRLYAAQGFRGQYVIVSSDQRLTIVRLGVTTEAEMPALRAALLRVIRLFPEG